MAKALWRLTQYLESLASEELNKHLAVSKAWERFHYQLGSACSINFQSLVKQLFRHVQLVR